MTKNENQTEFENEVIDQMYENKSLKDHIDDQIKKAPWWAISLVAHGLMLIILGMIPFMADTPKTEEIVIQTEIVEETIEDEKEEIKKIFEEKVVEVTEVEVEEITEEVEVVEEVDVETEVVVDTMEEVTDVTEFSLDLADTPNVGAGALGEIGLGDSGGGAGGPLGGRASAGARKRAVSRHGGKTSVLTAVDRALLYLARVQAEDGGWYPGNHEGKDGERYNVSMTGAALLCFLGAGHSEIAGKHKETVVKAVNWLIKQQGGGGGSEDGGGGNGFFSDNMYAHGIASLAMTEAYAMGLKSRTKKSAQSALDAIFTAQNKFGGWNYGSNQPRCDVSVMGWQMMAIKSGKIGKLNVNEAKIKLALNELSNATDGDYGRVGYAKRPGEKTYSGHDNARMNYIGMCIKQFYGMGKNNPQLTEPAAQLIADGQVPLVQPGKGAKAPKENSYYQMYYGALVMFQMGGNYWKAWKEPMLAFLEPTQDKSGGPLDGSWDPKLASGVHGGKEIGRIGSTAFYCLALEVFWRYMPLYK